MEGPAGDEALVGEEAKRPVVHRRVVLAQVGDVEHQVRRVLGQLVLGIAERDPREVLLRLVELARDVLQAPQLEGHLHRPLPVGQRFQEQPAGARQQLLVGAERVLRIVRVLRLLVAGDFRPRHHRAPGRPLQPAPRLPSGPVRGEVLAHDLFVQRRGPRLLPEPVEQLRVEEAQLVGGGRVREQRQVIGVQRLGGRVRVLESSLLCLVVELDGQVAQRLLRVLLRFLEGLAAVGVRARGLLHPLERLHQRLRLAQQVLPLPAARGDHEQARLIERRARARAVDLQQLAVDQLRLGVAALVEEQLAVLLEHLLAGLRAELLPELLARARRRRGPRVDQHVVPARLARELHLVRLVSGGARGVAAEADRHHLVQELHRVGERVLVEAAPGRLVERVRGRTRARRAPRRTWETDGSSRARRGPPPRPSRNPARRRRGRRAPRPAWARAGTCGGARGTARPPRTGPPAPPPRRAPPRPDPGRLPPRRGWSAPARARAADSRAARSLPPAPPRFRPGQAGCAAHAPAPAPWPARPDPRHGGGERNHAPAERAPARPAWTRTGRRRRRRRGRWRRRSWGSSPEAGVRRAHGSSPGARTVQPSGLTRAPIPTVVGSRRGGRMNACDRAHGEIRFLENRGAQPPPIGRR